MALRLSAKERVHLKGRAHALEPVVHIGNAGITEAVIAEVYPSLIPVKPEPAEVPDRAQVRALAEYFAKLDEAGKLGAVFAAKPGEDV